MSNLVEAALSYAEKGYHVFPCKPRTKAPATPNGFRDATTDEETIRGWWSENAEYNIAIRTGPESGVFVLDMDSPEAFRVAGEHGYIPTTALYGKEGKRGEMPDACIVKTGRGFQVYFEYGEEVRNSAGGLGEGLDVRGDGGYVLAPGSVHPNGETYEYYGPRREPTPAPDRLLRAIRDGHSRRGSVDFERPIPEGQRNAELSRIAGNLTRSGMSAESARECLHIINRNQCRPPLPDDEVNGITLYPNEEASSSSSPKQNDGDDSDTLPRVRRFVEMTPPKGPRPYIVAGVLFEGFAGAIYGDGGSAKSLLMMHLGQCVARGDKWLGFDTVNTNVLYLDFELDEDEQSRRAYQVAAGMGYGELPDNCFYISGTGYGTRTVFDHALDVCLENGIEMVIVDSLGYAQDGDAEASRDVLKFFREVEGAFRRESISLLIVDHQSKNGQYKDKTMFGSVYKSNSVRSVFQVEPGERGDGCINLTLRHKKVNFGPLLEPFGARVEFVKDEDDPDQVKQIRFDTRELDAGELAGERSLNAKDRVLMALADGPMYPDDIVVATGLELPTVKNTLTALRKIGAVRDTGNKDTKGSHEVSLSSLINRDDDSDDARQEDFVRAA